MSKTTRNAISSPALGAGPTQLDLLAGLTTDPCGPAPVPASRSRSQGGGRVLLTTGTYGPTFSDSSAPAVPQSSWESRLRERLGTLGSMEYDLTWRRKVTPAGRSISRLAPSMRRTGETGCTGWPTPRASPNENRNAQSAPSHGETHGLTLAGVAHDLTGWPTASARDWRDPRASAETMAKNDRPLNEVAGSLAGWCTPTTPSGGQTNPAGTTIAGRRPDGGKATVTLKDQVSQVSGTPSSSPGQTPKAGTAALNPEFCSWLMGFPPEWLNSAPSAMRLSRKSRQKS